MIKDYHTHTCCSDGTKTPEELIDLALSNGVQGLYISDHDSIDGLEKAFSYSEGKLCFCSGVEFTTREQSFPGLEEKYCLHLLGYGFDIYDGSLSKALKDRDSRVKAAYGRLIKGLEKYGMFFDYSKVPTSCGIVMQMCDIAAYIKEHYPGCAGLSSATEEVFAFSKELDSENCTLEESVRLIHQAKGKAVWAHPFNVYKSFSKRVIDETAVEKILKTAVSLGVDGIEALYGDFSAAQRLALCSLAERYGLFVTCGSDFHGFKNKRNRFIGFDTDDYSQFNIL